MKKTILLLALLTLVVLSACSVPETRYTQIATLEECKQKSEQVGNLGQVCSECKYNQQWKVYLECNNS